MSLRPLREVGLVFPSLGHAQHSCHPVASTKQCSTVWSDVLSSKGHCQWKKEGVSTFVSTGDSSLVDPPR